jgi:hypothetical protein
MRQFPGLPGAALRFKTVVLALAVAAASSFGLTPATFSARPAAANPSAASQSIRCVFDPYVVQTDAGNGNHQFYDISAVGKNDLWAVGYETKFGRPLAYHWNGQRWKSTRTTEPHADWHSIVYQAVAARTATDVWAAGQEATDSDARVIIDHWNGTRWSHSAAIAMPGVSESYELHVLGAVALSATDAWVTGWGGFTEGYSVFTLHWDGVSWSRIPVPEAQTGGEVAGNSAGAVWLTGFGSGSPYLFRWSGSAWVAEDTGGQVAGALRGVDVSKNGKVTLVGKTGPGMPLAAMGPVPSWRSQSVPVPDGSYVELDDVATVTDQNVWAIGRRGTADRYALPYPILYHWNGTAWKRIRTPMDGTNGIAIQAVTRVPGTKRVYGAGYYKSGSFGDPDDLVIERLC